MLASATYSITNNEKAMSAKETLDLCEFSSLATNECMSAQNTWDNAIQTSWSLAAIGLLFATFTIFSDGFHFRASLGVVWSIFGR